MVSIYYMIVVVVTWLQYIYIHVRVLIYMLIARTFKIYLNTLLEVVIINVVVVMFV